MTPTVINGPPPHTDASVEALIIGAGACGLTAALRAHHAGREVLILERDETPSGSTSLSSGFVPAPGTRFQKAINVEDTSDLFCADLMAKSHDTSDQTLARIAADNIAPAIEWLADHAGIEWIVLDDFLYPGHSRYRMHAVPEKTGSALQARLLTAAADIPIATNALATTLYREGHCITAVGVDRGETTEIIACEALVFACNGYGGNPDLVAKYIPEIADGPYFGHAGNTGDAVLWGEAMGADLLHLSGYQGHGSVAHPHGILITWALMMEGGVQLNVDGRRFSNEHLGYSEQGPHVLAQPGRIAWDVYDATIHEFAMNGFPDYRDAHSAGAVKVADTATDLASLIGAPVSEVEKTLAHCAALPDAATDPFGRDFSKGRALTPPYYAIKVTGALFHTQGGLRINKEARVMTPDGPLANLYAGGGAACGVSGPDVSGYLSGNGLLTALAFGYLAGGYDPIA